MKILQKLFGCGELLSKQSMISFKVIKFSDIVNIIIPFFDKYPLQGSKRLDYDSFVKVMELMKDKLHLTPSGLEQIQMIKGEMNRKRF